MRKPPLGKIPKARVKLTEVIKDKRLPRSLYRKLLAVRKLMYREKPIRRAKGKRVILTPGRRRALRRLVHSGRDLTYHQIATAFGLRSSGRVSEIVHPPKHWRQRRRRR